MATVSAREDGKGQFLAGHIATPARTVYCTVSEEDVKRGHCVGS